MSRAPEWFREVVSHALASIRAPYPAAADLDRLAMLSIESGRDWRGPRAFEAKR